jgi:hypothetical protein
MGMIPGRAIVMTLVTRSHIDLCRVWSCSCRRCV